MDGDPPDKRGGSPGPSPKTGTNDSATLVTKRRPDPGKVDSASEPMEFEGRTSGAVHVAAAASSPENDSGEQTDETMEFEGRTSGVAPGAAAASSPENEISESADRPNPLSQAFESDSQEELEKESKKLFYSAAVPAKGSEVTPRATTSVKASVSAPGLSQGPVIPAKKDDLPLVKLFGERHAARMLLVLWPAPEHKKEFKRCSGCDLDPVRYYQDLEFRDSYQDFMRRTVPSPEHRDRLRKRALEIARKSKAGRAFHVEQRSKFEAKLKSGSSPTTSRGQSASKRGREVSISPLTGRLNPHRQGPREKTPRLPAVSPPRETTQQSKGQHESVNQVSPSSSSFSEPRASGPVLGGDSDDDVIPGSVDEDHPDVDSFTTDAMRDALPRTAAEVVQKVSYPHALFVYEGQEERKLMAKSAWNILAVKIQDAALEAMMEGVTLSVADMRFHYGKGCILCEDEETAIHVKGLVSALTVAEATFRAWARGDVGEWTELTLRLPPSMPASKIAAVKIMKACAIRNNWPKDLYRIRDFKAAPGSTRDSILRFGARSELVDVIKASRGALKVGCSTIHVHYKGQLLIE